MVSGDIKGFDLITLGHKLEEIHSKAHQQIYQHATADNDRLSRS